MLKLSYQTLAKLFAAGLGIAILCIIFLDRAVYEIIHPAFLNQRELWEKITYIGDSEWMALLTLGIIGVGLVFSLIKPSPFWSKTWRSGLFVFSAIALVGIAAMLVKNSIGRARPYLFETEGTFSFSPFAFEHAFAGFPSGHTTTAFVFATALAILFPRFALPAFAIAILAGFSRMAVDAHYLGDVVFGATFGTIGTIAVAKWLMPKIDALKKKAQ